MKEYSNMFRVCPSGQTLSMYNHFVNPCPLSRSHSSTPQLKLILSLPATLFKLLPRPARARIIRIHFLLRHLYRPVQPIRQIHHRNVGRIRLQVKAEPHLPDLRRSFREHSCGKRAAGCDYGHIAGAELNPA